MLMVMNIVWRWIWGDSIIGMIIIVKIDLILFVKCCMNNVFFIVCNIFFKELFYKLSIFIYLELLFVVNFVCEIMLY